MIDRPLNPWWMVAAGALGTSVGAGIFSVYSLGVFVAPISADLGWNRSVLAACITIFLFSTGLGTVWLGRLISRFGLRTPSVLFVAIYVATVAAIALLPAIPLLFYLNFFIMGIAGAAACPMPYAVAICGFFDRRRGLALGIMMLGAGLGAMLSPQLSAYLLNAFGWRNALLLIAMIAAAPILSIIFWLRNPPQTGAGEVSIKGAPAEAYLKRREFYLIAGAIAGNSVAAVGIMTSIVPLATDRGISMAEAATMLSVAGAAAFAGRLIVGWLFDKAFAPYVGATVFILAAIGALLIAWGGGGLTSYIGAGLVGTCLGAEADFVSFMVSRYFSTALFSRVVGAMWVAWAWGGGIGTYLAGLSYDWTGSYVNAFIGFVALLILSAALLLRMPPYFYAHGNTDPMT